MIMWSILICALQERVRACNFLLQKLRGQITKVNLASEIEVIKFCDNRERTVGTKRNQLVEKARGKYISFIDDDDDISDDYIRLLYQGLKQDLDCVSLVGLITTNGKNSQRFVHSIQYKEYTKQNGVYYRPPNHLNVTKRDLVINFKFPEKNFSEDFDWSMAISRAGVLKTEARITKPYYFYRAISKKCI